MAEYESSTTPDEITPEERQRRLGEVYGLLISLARRKRAGQGQPDELTQTVRSNASSAGGSKGYLRGIDWK